MKKPLSLHRPSVRRQFDRRADRIAEANFLLREIQRRMLSRLEYIKLVPETILDLGCAQANASVALSARYPQAHVIAMDLSEAMVSRAKSRQIPLQPHSSASVGFLRKLITNPFAASSPQRAEPISAPLSFLAADAHALPIATGSVDLVWCNLALHWFDDPVAALAEWRRVVKPGGLVLFSSFGPDTLVELAHIGAQLPTFQDLHDLGDALQNQKFAEPVMDMEKLNISYQTSERLLADLSALGGNALLERFAGLRGRQFKAELLFNASKILPGSVSFEVVYGHAWAPTKPWLPAGLSPIEFRPRPQKAE